MQEKVQFFNSQSSFGSESSLANSRYFDLTNQINEQVEKLFLTLRKQFLPTKQLTDYDKIQYLINRANIVATDTIPQHINYLQKISTQKQIKNPLIKNKQQLIKLIKSFQSLRNDNITHKQFYNIYCRNNEQGIFMKKSTVRGILQIQQQQNHKNNYFLQPDIIVLSSRPYNNPQTQHKIGVNISNNKTNNKQKQIRQLQQQIYKIKKIQQNNKKQFDLFINKQKLNNEKRIKYIYQTIDSKSFNTQIYNNMIKNELNQKQIQLQQYIIKNNELIQQNSLIQKKYELEMQQNQSLKEQLSKYRKLQMSNYQQVDWDNQSVHSQLNSSKIKDSKKLTINIKKLQGERDLLKNQLIKQRQKKYNQKNNISQLQSKQLIKNKKYIQQKNIQYQEILKLLDQTKIQSIQLKQQNQILKKDISTIKQNHQIQNKYNNNNNNNKNNNNINNNNINNININNNNKNNNNINNNINIDHKSNYKRTPSELQSSKVLFSKFNQYQGQGIQGIPYFQLLSKQFRIRFKRSCLKQKQLLYKANNLQVGIITQFFAPNFIKILVHLTNYGDKNIKNLKIKLMNPNQNKLDSEIDQVPLLNSNQQIKTAVSCLIKNYPIGPVVFLLDYQIDVTYQLRLLLPVHIFKCVTITKRSQKLLNPIKFTIKTQKKICKDQKSLKQYFNCPLNQDIKVKIRHQHSNSSLIVDAFYDNQQITILYEHIQGYNNFTEYFIKTLRSILQKQN